MLRAALFGETSLATYARSAGDEAIAELRELARGIQGLRVLHLNSTSFGGGVAEILRSEVPLLNDLGLAAEWRVINGTAEFFAVTKAIHNGLQGAERSLREPERQLFVSHAQSNARRLDGEYDVVVVHDPQPLPILHFHGKASARWVWRCHLDTSRPNLSVWRLLRPYVADYDSAVFTHSEFIPPDVPVGKIAVIPPAIDPESPKNMRISHDLARRLVRYAGIDLARPLMAQVGRFDAWKDPLGVIVAYRTAKQVVPGLQLALVAGMAPDDPEGWEIYQHVKSVAGTDPDIHLFTNLMGGSLDVNAFQRLADVVVQKSIREGFGLVVSESLWKNTPVVASAVGGIPLQLAAGAGGFLVGDIQECADRVVWLLQHPHQAALLARAGKERVRQMFLLPRLVRDELRLYTELIASAAPPIEGPSAPPTRGRGAGLGCAA